MKRYPAVFKDGEAERIISSIDYDFSQLTYTSFVILSWAVRKHFLLGCARAYLKEHPRATIVNLGCGADTCYEELDNGLCHFINLDLPEVIAAREQFTKCHEREKNVAASAFDLSWLTQIETKTEDGLFVMSGGVLFYFEAEKIRALDKSIKKEKSIPFGTRFAVNMGMKMGFMQFVEIRFR